MTDSEKFYVQETEENGHFNVLDHDDQVLGSVTETEDGWRAYNLDGSELPGGEVYTSQHEAASAIHAQLEGDAGA